MHDGFIFFGYTFSLLTCGLSIQFFFVFLSICVFPFFL